MGVYQMYNLIPMRANDSVISSGSSFDTIFYLSRHEYTLKYIYMCEFIILCIFCSLNAMSELPINMKYLNKEISTTSYKKDGINEVNLL